MQISWGYTLFSATYLMEPPEILNYILIFIYIQFCQATLMVLNVLYKQGIEDEAKLITRMRAVGISLGIFFLVFLSLSLDLRN